MTDQEKPAEKKRISLPSGSQYIGICQSRAQASSLRLQRAIVFMAANAALAGWFINLAEDMTKGRHVVYAAVICSLGSGLNFIWFRQILRENRFINFYTGCLAALEMAHGTETGVVIFSAVDFPAVVRPGEMSFRTGLQIISFAGQVLWCVACAGALVALP